MPVHLHALDVVDVESVARANYVLEAWHSRVEVFSLNATGLLLERLRPVLELAAIYVNVFPGFLMIEDLSARLVLLFGWRELFAILLLELFHALYLAVLLLVAGPRQVLVERDTIRHERTLAFQLRLHNQRSEITRHPLGALIV